MNFKELEFKGKTYRFFFLDTGSSLWIHFEGLSFEWKEEKKKEKKKENLSEETLFSELPSRVSQVFVKKGDKVSKGDLLLLLSAMKIDYSFKASLSGIVKGVFVKEGESVPQNQKLIHIKKEDV